MTCTMTWPEVAVAAIGIGAIAFLGFIFLMSWDGELPKRRK